MTLYTRVLFNNGKGPRPIGTLTPSVLLAISSWGST